jgi:quercetin dioxygenase-like cupin family protein
VKPFVLHFRDALRTAEGEIEVRTLLLREAAEVSKSELIRLEPGAVTREQSHSDEEEAYLILNGQGYVILDGEEHAVEAPCFVWIPRNCRHFVRAGDGPLEYVYFAAFI